MSTQLEKQSLEAHVDLCAERYGHLKTELETLQKGQLSTNLRLDKLEQIVTGIAERLNEKENSALKTIIRVGGTFIVMLLGALSAVLWYTITSN